MSVDNETAERIATALEGIEIALVALTGKTPGLSDTRLTRAELDDARRVIRGVRDR